MKVTDFELHRLHLRLPEPIGDSQVRFEDHWITVVELLTDLGPTGVGFDCQQGLPTAKLDSLVEEFRYAIWPSIAGGHPQGLAHRIVRPRGGNVGPGYRTRAVETALWDLAAKEVDLPLYRFLGGEKSSVPAYGSTLDFRLDDRDFRAKLERMREFGFRAFKTKVGHPDIEWDLRRLALVHDVAGAEIDLMVDANEAWSVKETRLRLNRYRDAGFNIFWIEDPITREDYSGYRDLRSHLDFTRVNTGEYLGFSGKRRLLENDGVDVLNIHDSISASRAAATLAGDYGIPVSLGNTLLELGVHLAASLPECVYLEYSDLVWNELAQERVRIENGYAHAPDRPGHGIRLDRDRLAFYAQPG